MKGQIIHHWLAVVLLAAIFVLLTGCQASLVHNAPSTDISLSSVDIGIFDEVDLLSIMDEAETMLLNGKTTITNPSMYVKFFFSHNAEILSDCTIQDKGTITINYSKSLAERKTVLQYGLFLHLLTSRYPDCICEVDYAYDPMNMNRVYDAFMFFYPDYNKAGYSTVLDCYKAIESNSMKSPDNSFYISFNDFFQIFESGRNNTTDGISRYSYMFEHYGKYLSPSE